MNQAFHNDKEPDDSRDIADKGSLDPDSLLKQYPGLKEELKSLFHGLEDPGNRKIFGLVLGDFKILREIGSGGMATVYEAEQISLNRKVALKILPAHLSYSRRAIMKFLREAEAGGRQSHPGIVAIYAVGEHENVHYIAQELVGNGFNLGHGIERIRKDRRIPKGYFQRMAKLFSKIADALQHAHESGVIHRDIKPSNILITNEEQPKVSDFGMARVEGALILSRTGDFSGTPYYMSPEQARGRREDIDHRSDIFSLGVTFFEALTLKLPFYGTDTHAVLKKIVYNEPKNPLLVNPDVPKDLATICLKAMDKEPDRRYQTMAELAGDLKRFICGDDILARPMGRTYRLLRKVRRNPALSSLAMLALAAVTLLFSYVLWSYPLILKERDRALKASEAALREAEKAKAINRFMQDMVSSPVPGSKHRTSKVMDVLDRAAKEASTAFTNQPKVEAGLRGTLGNTYYGLGMYAKAKEQYESASMILKETLGEEHPETLIVLEHLATTLSALGKLDESESLYRKVIDLQERLLGKEHPETLQSNHNLATTLTKKGDIEGASVILRWVIEARSRVLGDEDIDTLSSLNNFSNLLMEMGRFSEAEENLRNALRIHEQALGEEHPDTIGLYVNLTSALTEQYKLQEAELLAQKSLKLCQQVLGKNHPKTFVAECTLGNLFMIQEKYGEAEKIFNDLLERQRQVLGRTHPDTLVPAINLAFILSEQNRDQEAEAHFKETLTVANRVLPKNHMLKATLHMFYGEFLAKTERYEEAEKMLLEGFNVIEWTFGEDEADTQDAIRALVQLYELWGKPEKAAEFHARLPSQKE